MCKIVCLSNLWQFLSTSKLFCCKNITWSGIFVTYMLAWSHILCWIYNLILSFIRWDNRKFYDGSGLTESLFSNHKDKYSEYERASLGQLYWVKVLIVSTFFTVQIEFGCKMLYVVLCNADGRTTSWKPAYIWFIWDHWMPKRIFNCFF